MRRGHALRLRWEMVAETELSVTDDFGGPMAMAEAEAHINAVLEKYKQYVNPGVTRLLQFRNLLPTLLQHAVDQKPVAQSPI